MMREDNVPVPGTSAGMEDSVDPISPSTSDNGLSDQKRFEKAGFLLLPRVLEVSECRRISKKLHNPIYPADWIKGFGATSPLIYGLATRKDILDPVRAVLGNDVMLWGATIVRRMPGDIHPWHTDIESSHPDGGTASVWVGLENVNRHSSLQLISRSHRLGRTIQEIAAESGVARDDINEEHVLMWAKELDSACGLVRADIGVGDAILFDGRLWHGSNNTNRWGERAAILLQYAVPGRDIRIPDFEHLVWPFRTFSAPRPACILVSGNDGSGANRIVEPPERDRSSALSTWLWSRDFPLAGDAKTGWKPYYAFRGPTPRLVDFGCHCSVLSPGTTPHPPHQHDEEEILIMVSGSASLVTLDGGPPAPEESRTLSEGSLVYYPAGQWHTIRNEGTEDATYLMFKWRGAKARPGDVMTMADYHFDDIGDESPGDGFATRTLFEGRTGYLHKLHCHATTLEPGAGYEPHADPYDVAIFVLEGEVETLEERLGPKSVIFYASGELHGMRNVGDSPARYLVFEFHSDGTGLTRGASILSRLHTRSRRYVGRTLRHFPAVRRLVRRG